MNHPFMDADSITDRVDPDLDGFDPVWAGPTPEQFVADRIAADTREYERQSRIERAAIAVDEAHSLYEAAEQALAFAHDELADAERAGGVS